MVEAVFDLARLGAGERCQITGLGQVLADKTVGVLVGAALQSIT